MTPSEGGQEEDIFALSKSSWNPRGSAAMTINPDDSLAFSKSAATNKFLNSIARKSVANDSFTLS